MCRQVLLSFLVIMASMTVLRAQAPPDEWEVRTFRVPAGYWWNAHQMTLESDQRALSAPSLPSPTASEPEWDAYIRDCSALIAPLLNAHGILTPRGTLLLQDAASGTLVVRSTRSNLEMIEALTDETVKLAPWSIGVTLDIAQADAAAIRSVVTETTGRAGHDDSWRKLQALIEGGDASHVCHFHLEGRSGQLLRTGNGTELSHVTGLRLDALGRLEFLRKRRCIGTLLEITPVIAPNGILVEADLTLEHDFSPPIARDDTVWVTDTILPIKVPATDFRRTRIDTSIAMFGGTTRLLGVWKTDNQGPLPKREILQAAFLGMDVIHGLPEENKGLMGRMQGYIDRHVATTALTTKDQPEARPTSLEVPPGMERRSFKVPPDFLGLLLEPLAKATPAPADPFAPENAHIMVRDGGPTAEKIMEDRYGIRSPEGSSMIYQAATSRFIMTNTPENLERFQVLIHDLQHHLPKLLSHTLQIFEGEGAVMRRLVTGARGHAAQNSLLDEMEQLASRGQLSVRNVTRIDGLSERSLMFETGTSRMDHGVLRHAEGKVFPSIVQVPGFVGPPFDLAKDLEEAPSGLMTADCEIRMVGTHLTVKPILSPGDWVVDVACHLEHHFAPPTVRGDARHGAVHDKSSVTSFHCENVDTSLSFPSGMVKLLGVWNVSTLVGTPAEDRMHAAFLRVDVVTLDQ